MKYEKLKCKNGHTKLAATIINKEENWVEIYCPTCCYTIWYNGA